jgi:hypothetical protein
MRESGAFADRRRGFPSAMTYRVSASAAVKAYDPVTVRGRHCHWGFTADLVRGVAVWPAPHVRPAWRTFRSCQYWAAIFTPRVATAILMVLPRSRFISEGLTHGVDGLNLAKAEISAK